MLSNWLPKLKKTNKKNNRRLTSLSLLVCLYCVVLTVSSGKISWHGTNGVLIINNTPDTQAAMLVLSCPYCAGRKELRGKRANKSNLISEIKETHLKTKRAAVAPWCNTLTPAALQNKALLWHFITRGITKQRAPAPSLFPSHFHFLWFAHHRPRSNMPPQPSQILSVLRGKSADSQHKGKPMLLCGHRSAAQGATRCQVNRHQAISYHTSYSAELTQLKPA